MLAMQYQFTLPTDYDMNRIVQRINSKGPLLDDFPGLLFKAYLYHRADDSSLPGKHNLYAPFYLWENNEAMNRFLHGPGFLALQETFGRPTIRWWSVWQAILPEKSKHQHYASQQIHAVAPDNLPHAQLQSVQQQTRLIEQGASAVVSGYDPVHWTQVCFALWEGIPPGTDEWQYYQAGYVAHGQPTGHN